MLICPDCGEEKDEGEFGRKLYRLKDGSRRERLNTYCKACHSKQVSKIRNRRYHEDAEYKARLNAQSAARRRHLIATDPEFAAKERLRQHQRQQEAKARKQLNNTRACKDCGTGIADLPPRTRYCEHCAKSRRKKMVDRYSAAEQDLSGKPAVRYPIGKSVYFFVCEPTEAEAEAEVEEETTETASTSTSTNTKSKDKTKGNSRNKGKTELARQQVWSVYQALSDDWQESGKVQLVRTGYTRRGALAFCRRENYKLGGAYSQP